MLDLSLVQASNKGCDGILILTETVVNLTQLNAKIARRDIHGLAIELPVVLLVRIGSGFERV
jgi:hypothetical protein